MVSSWQDPKKENGELIYGSTVPVPRCCIRHDMFLSRGHALSMDFASRNEMFVSLSHNTLVTSHDSVNILLLLVRSSLQANFVSSSRYQSILTKCLMMSTAVEAWAMTMSTDEPQGTVTS